MDISANQTAPTFHWLFPVFPTGNRAASCLSVAPYGNMHGAVTGVFIRLLLWLNKRSDRMAAVDLHVIVNMDILAGQD
jgi:hypothetical protein